jgi:glutathionyl-hydroquinone reductase
MKNSPSSTANSDSGQFPKEMQASGEFKRQASVFRNWVKADGSSDFPAEKGRYHLYVSYACPWAHRAILVRKLKKLENIIGMTVVDPLRDARGWAFTEEADPNQGFEFLAQAYLATDPSFDGRVTVPVLWDKKTGVIVNNESSEVIRILNSEFNQWGDANLDLYPAADRDQIDAINTRIYEAVNNGVYRAGFATSQGAYETAVHALFQMLEKLDATLSSRRFLIGTTPTEADWRLFTTLIRFDAVYVGHFKCNLKRIVDFPNLWGYLRDLYQIPGVAETVNFDHIKRHYYLTHAAINPTGVVSVGPVIDFSQPPGRSEVGR